MKTARAKVYYFDGIKGSQVQKCIFCNKTENLQPFRNQILCSDCLRNIRKLYSCGYFNKEKLTIC